MRRNRQPPQSSSNGNQNQHRQTTETPNSLLRLTRYEHMNDLARLFFAQHSELLPTSNHSKSNSTTATPTINPSPILGSNNNNNNSILNSNNLSNIPTQPNVSTPRKSNITSQKQQKLNAVEHTLKTPSEWKEGLDDMPIILVNMIEDTNLVRLSPESRIALLISGDGDSQEYLSVLPSHIPKAVAQAKKLKSYIKCKFNDKLMNGEIITRGSSNFIEVNIDTLYSTFFPADNIAKYETTKIIELEVSDGKQTKSFSFNCCKTKTTRNLKRTTIIYGVEEARIKNQVLQNEEKVRKTIERLSDQSSSSTLNHQNTPKLIDVKPTIQKPTIVRIPQNTVNSVSNPQHQQQQQQQSTPRKITRETLDHNGRVTNIITEYYNNDSPKKKVEPLVPIIKANSIPKEVISIDDDVTAAVTPSRKKRKPNIVNNSNNSIILIEDEKPPVRSVKPKQEEPVIIPTEPTTPKKTISFSSVINLDD